MITAAMCSSGRELTEPQLSPDGTQVLFGVRSAGQSALAIVPADGGPERLLACDPSPSLGRGFGGGAVAWLPDGSGLVYAGSDGQLWRRGLDGTAASLTDVPPGSVSSCPAVSPDGRSVAYVVDQSHVRVVDLANETDRPAGTGGDFVLDPAWHPDSRTHVWTAWSVPHMPWDESIVAGEGGVVAGTAGAQIQQPRFDPDGTLWSVRDTGGWLNVWRGEEPLVAEPFEHAGPTWGAGQRSYVLSPDGSRVAFTRNERGFGRLCVVDVAGGPVAEVAKGVHGQLSWKGETLVALRSGARTPTQIVAYDTATWQRQVLVVGPVAEWDAAELIEPDVLKCPAGDHVVPMRLYRPARGSAGTICWIHGGPTDQWQVTFLPRIAYWVSRGWTVVVPDSRGSTGHGRAYQQALRGRWGEADVEDVANVLALAHTSGWSTPTHTVLMGGSAGGFTALNVAIRHPDLVAAAAVVYPVTDLATLDAYTHRFEAHYTSTLVSPQEYADRSPLSHAHELARPVLVLHGDSDPVVPLTASAEFVRRAAAAGADATLHVYEGEGHGFRQPANQRDELERVEAFLRRCVSGAPG